MPACLLCENPLCSDDNDFGSLIVVAGGVGSGFTNMPLILVKIFLNTETLSFIKSIIIF